MRRSPAETARRFLLRRSSADSAPLWLAAMLGRSDDWGAEGRLPFLAGLVLCLAAGCVLKARHDTLSAFPPARDLPPAPEDITRLAAWGWHWNEDEDAFESFFPADDTNADLIVPGMPELARRLSALLIRVALRLDPERSPRPSSPDLGPLSAEARELLVRADRAPNAPPILRSLSQADYDRLPRLTDADIQAALDEGRPSGDRRFGTSRSAGGAETTSEAPETRRNPPAPVARPALRRVVRRPK